MIKLESIELDLVDLGKQRDELIAQVNLVLGAIKYAETLRDRLVKESSPLLTPDKE